MHDTLDPCRMHIRSPISATCCVRSRRACFSWKSHNVVIAQWTTTQSRSRIIPSKWSVVGSWFTLAPEWLLGLPHGKWLQSGSTPQSAAWFHQRYLSSGSVGFILDGICLMALTCYSTIDKFWALSATYLILLSNLCTPHPNSQKQTLTQRRFCA